MLFGSNGNSYTVCTVSDIRIYTRVLHNIETLVGKKKLKVRTVVNVVSQGNLSACHFGHARDRLVTIMSRYGQKKVR